MTVLYLLGFALALIVAYTKDKKITFISTVIVVLLLSAVRDGNDVTNYYFWYYSNRNEMDMGILSEWFYTMLAFGARTIGFNFYWFKALLAILAIVCIYKATKRYRPNYGFVLVNYYIYFIFVDCQQLKNFYGVAVWMVALYVYIFRQSKWEYIAGCICAMGMHTAFALYTVLGFINGKLSKRFVKWLGVVVFGVFLILMANRNIIRILAIFISSIFNDESGRMGYYLLNRTNYGFLPPVLLYLFSLAIYKYGYKQLNIQRSIDKCNSQKEVEVVNMRFKFMDFFFHSNIIMLVVFPMCLFSLVFYRILRNIYFVNIFVFSIMSSEMRHNKTWLLFNTSVLICTLGWFIADVFIYYGTEETLDLIFKGAMFWM